MEALALAKMLINHAAVGCCECDFHGLPPNCAPRCVKNSLTFYLKLILFQCITNQSLASPQNTG
jgi:hypothetical protein